MKDTEGAKNMPKPFQKIELNIICVNPVILSKDILSIASTVKNAKQTHFQTTKITTSDFII